MMTDAKLASLIASLVEDAESDHVEADRLICALLLELGYPLTVAAFEKMYKWYA